tara:strand:+ start:154 stop:1668 length:1515 start_codon:yes stop_codon:yes gene_type:complete
MALLPITPPPGIVTNGTTYSNKGRWTDGDLVRFENGSLTPIGGWEKLRSTALTGTPTGMYSYVTNAGKQVLAVGTRSKVYVLFDGTWYDITPSNFVTDASTDPLGFGAYQYGQEDYGDARSQSGLTFNTHSFSFDNFGEFLIFTCSSDGKIYQWQPASPSAVATAVTNAPVGNQAVIVSNERHLVALGSASDPRKVAWSSREALNTWTASATNSAGDLQVPTGGRILGGKRWQNEIVIFTDVGINSMYYTGQPFIYGIREAGTNCRAIGIRSVVHAGNFLAWMGENSFFIYDGSVKEIPCEVNDYIFDNLYYLNRETVAGGHNSNFNEIWWFFPSDATASTSNPVPDKYVIWNYKENVWSIGSMERTCWTDQGVFDYPIACDSAGNVYQHESKSLFNSPSLGTSVPFCESGPIEIGNGDNYMQCNQIIPDSEANSLPGVTLSFKGRFTPLGPETDFGSFSFDSSDGYTDARFSARQVQMKVTGDTNQNFKVGKIRLDLKKRGRR